ncbi:Smr/MutS family protein [Niveibacterium terrae]|uniref:Smr/MutS family protein n=1 Tax=Niveibacterium terrae TaxID=3373598 RepID=UPI003A8DEB2A
MKKSSDKTPSPFAVLKTLEVRQAPRTKIDKLREQARKGPEPAGDIDFAQAMSGAVRLPASDQAEIARPRPAPVPRPKEREEKIETAPARPRAPLSDAAAYRSAMQDVIALAPSGRIDPSLLNAPRAAMPRTPGKSEMSIEAWLDSAPDPDDPASLFLHAVGPAHSLPETGRAEIARPAPEPRPLQREADDREVLNESVNEPISFEDRLDMGDEPAFLRDGLPRRLLVDLRRGRWIVQAELDLHGLTRDEAREALGAFLAQRLARGERCVRIIHGKGLRSPGRVGILKQLSRNWLAQREEILGFCQAKPHDGGEGALLVLLRAPKPAS